MAIKIIKEGTKKPKVYRVECAVCGCVFEYEKEDAYPKQPYGYALAVTPEFCYHYVKCPQCQYECEHTERNGYEEN